jgi:hypothetical protein
MKNAFVPSVEPFCYSLFMGIIGINNIMNIMCCKVFYTLPIIVFI